MWIQLDFENTCEIIDRSTWHWHLIKLNIYRKEGYQITICCDIIISKVAEGMSFATNIVVCIQINMKKWKDNKLQITKLCCPVHQVYITRWRILILHLFCDWLTSWPSGLVICQSIQIIWTSMSLQFCF